MRSHLSERGSKRVAPKKASLQRRRSIGLHPRLDEVVADLRIRVTRGDLDAPHGMAVLGMGEQETPQRVLRRSSRVERSRERRHVARDGQGLLALHAGLLEALAEPRLELLLGHVPESRDRIGFARNRARAPKRNARSIERLSSPQLILPSMRKRAALVDRHVLGEIVDERAMRLDEQASPHIPGLEREIRFARSA